MPDINFHFEANFHLRSESEPTLDESAIQEKIRLQLPAADTDLARGRSHVENRISRLKHLGAPEVIYGGEYANLDRTICIDYPVTGYNSRLIGYTSAFSYYDGCTSLACEPFDTNAILIGSQQVSNSLELDLDLTTRDQNEVSILLMPGNVSSETLLSRYYVDMVSIADVTPIQSSFETTIERAAELWLLTHPERRTQTAWRDVIPPGESIYTCLMRRILSVGTPRNAVVLSFDRPFWHHCVHFGLGDWTAQVNFSAHPGPLFDIHTDG